jgi:hypothetical protein
MLEFAITVVADVSRADRCGRQRFDRRNFFRRHGVECRGGQRYDSAGRDLVVELVQLHG